MDNFNKTLQKLKSLDLSSCSACEAKMLLKQIGEIGKIVHVIRKGTEFTRIRLNRHGEIFNKIEELSYKPQEFNKTYQRASTPNKTMFYASSNQIDGLNAEKNIGLATALFEGMQSSRDRESEGEWKVTFSNWVVKEDLQLILVWFDNQMLDRHPNFEFVYFAFQNFLSKNPLTEDKTILFYNFLSSHFTKEKISNETDYLISALFSEIMIEQGFDGITYPSVRTAGKGINVALIPEVIDSKKVVCNKVVEFMVSKKKKDVNFVAKQISQHFILSENQTSWEWEY